MTEEKQGLSAIIIPVYNQLPMTQSIVRQIKQYTKEPYILIIVNNGSRDGTYDWLEEQKGKEDIHIIHKIKN